MVKLLALWLFLTTALLVNAQKPKDGLYVYKIAFSEHKSELLYMTCTVVMRGDSIKVIHNGTKNLSGKKGDVIDKGLLLIHIKTGKWIISHHPEDKDAKEIGGCSDGPTIVDLKKKIVWLC